MTKNKMLKIFTRPVELLLISIIVFANINCTKLPDPTLGLNNKISFVVNDADLVTSSSVKLTSSILCSVDNLFGRERGFCISLSNTSPTINDTKLSVGTGIGSFVANIPNLLPLRKYYFRPYIILGTTSNVLYGEIKNFTTLSAPPSILTSNPNNISYTSAICGGDISSDGGVAITQRGVCWNTEKAPTVSNSFTKNGFGIGVFSSSLAGLSAGTTYYVRAYVVNSTGTFYGNEVSFKTNALSTPILTTNNIINVTTNSAVSGGNISFDGGSVVLQRGICWSTTNMPTILNSKTINGSGLGNFSSSLTGLISGTFYFVRSYATNSVGTSYGPELMFTTSEIPPTVNSGSISSISSSTALYSGANVTITGGSKVVDKGVCWSNSASPTIFNSRISLGSGVGSLSATLSNLNPGVTYYVRAYATNSTGTSYSSQVTFTTNDVPPVVNAGSISSISSSSAYYSGASVATSGASGILDKGVCWSATSNPTLANSSVSLGSGFGSISASITNLNSSTLYYVRAYATNSGGTAYSNQLSFTTTCGLSAPSLLNPTNNFNYSRTTNLFFEWAQVCSATSYEIQLSRNSNFSNSVRIFDFYCGGRSYPSLNNTNQATTTSTTICINSGSSTLAGNWYWRVRAFDGTNYSPWSLTSAFKYVW